MVSEADLNPRGIRERLREVLASVQTLPPQDVEKVSGLIDAGEWGLALDTLCTQVYEYDIELPPAMRALVDELAERTNVDAKRLLGEA
jgi:hypothetical protein